MAEIIISNLIGLVIGLGTSFFSWWVLFHGIVPKIAFANSISKLPTDDEPSGWKYRFKFQNVGVRALLDVQVIARISIKGLRRPSSWSTIIVPLDWAGDKKAEMPRIPPKSNRVLRLFLNHTLDLKQSALFSEDIRSKANQALVTLEDLLAIRKEVTLTIYVSGYDAFSGARKVFQSKSYTLADIRDGSFSKLDVSTAAVPSSSNGNEDNSSSTCVDAQSGVSGDAPQAARP